ncbi:MAG: TolB family protein [Anaerolineae bacterium]|jgi:hypothetical protein
MLRTAPTPLLTLSLVVVLSACATRPTATAVPFEPVPGSSPIPSSIAPGEAVFSAAPRAALPSGVAIVYRDAAGLWAVEGPSSPRLLFSGAVADWRVAPDRTAVAVMAPSSDGVSLVVLDWDSGATMSVVSPADVRDGLGVSEPVAAADEPLREVAAIEWLPDSSALLVGSGVPGDVFGSVPDDLLLLANDGSLTRLLEPGEGGVPLPSPDGRLVALTAPALGEDNAVIAVVDAAGEGRRELMEHPAIRTDARLADVRLPRWSGDSSALLLVLPGRDDSGRPWMGADWSEIVRVPVDGAGIERTEIPVRGHASARGVSWSPDGAWIAYTRPAADDGGVSSGEESGASQELVISSWDGRDETVYATDPSLRFLAWSSDGESFIYGAGDSLLLGRRGAEPQSFGSLSGGAVKAAAVVDPGHVVLLGDELILREAGGTDVPLAGEAGLFEVLVP